jgi:hypothetical protein
VASRDRVETLDVGSYDRFRVQLVEAGFSSKDGGRTWTGPIAEPFRAFTRAEKMTIRIKDGWPFIQPQLTVSGMSALEHVDADGVVCLWQPGDASRQWTTFEGWNDRIAAWASLQGSGFSRVDETMDAHAYFEERHDALATVDLDALPIDTPNAECGQLRGRWRHKETVLELGLKRAVGKDVAGMWFYISELTAPPRHLADVRNVLAGERQLAAFERLLAAPQKGSKSVALLTWKTAHARNAMALLIDRRPGRGKGRHDEESTRVRALELAPIGERVLRLRAGDDAAWIENRAVLIFGAGAIGSQIAVLLARSGVRALTLVDRETLRPGNVVRHAAAGSWVGLPKVEGTRHAIAQCAPWTTVKTVEQSPWNPKRLREFVDDHDLVIDATGNVGFTEQLSRLLAGREEPLVSAALYRRGHVVRVCRQAPGDVPLAERTDSNVYPLVPHGEFPEQVALEAGCSAPVNLASPMAVASAAALAVQSCLDALRGTMLLPDEIHEVFSPLEEPPFDRIGRLPRVS